MIEWIKDRYLTWLTGKDKQTRDYEKWWVENIVSRASTVENMFMNFKYIIPVSTQIFNHNEPFGWYPNKDFKQYMYPARELGDQSEYYFARGYRYEYDGKFHFNELCGQDQVFVVTNNEKDAIMIALKYS